MPAIVPTSRPEGTESWRRGRETGPPTEAGGFRSNQGTGSGENATNGGLGQMGAGCNLTQDTTQTTRSSTTAGAVPDIIRDWPWTGTAVPCILRDWPGTGTAVPPSLEGLGLQSQAMHKDRNPQSGTVCVLGLVHTEQRTGYCLIDTVAVPACAQGRS